MTTPAPSARTHGLDDNCSGFERVASAGDVPPEALLAVRTRRGDEICLANHDGRIFAVQDRCTHQAFPLSVGELLPDGTIECAWHGAQFDCKSGCVRQGPAEEPVATYEVRTIDGCVEVRRNDNS